jgi:hypothetical protein
VYIVADDPYYQWIVRRCLALGIPVDSSFDIDFDTQLPRAVGHTLVVAMVGDRLVLPAEYWPAQTALSVDELRRGQRQTARGIFLRRRADGTLLCVLYGRDTDALRRTVDESPP